MSQVVLADEINRATPKTQSALLECMEERQATVDGTTYLMPDPFLVIATQNPIEYEGTFALPEAQLDRFMLRIKLGYPQPVEEVVILDEQKRTAPDRRPRGGLLASRSCRRCSARSARSTSTRRSPTTSSGSSTARATTATSTSAPSPRGSIALYRAGQALAGLLGRDYVIPDDVKALAEAALAHRMIIKTSSSIHDVQPAQVIRELLETTPVGAVREPAVARPQAHRARRPRCPTRLSASQRRRPSRLGGSPMFRRLQLLLLAAILVLAAFSTGEPFLFYLVYLGVLVVGGSYVLTRLGLADLEAGYAVNQLSGHVGDRIRVTYTLRNTSRIPKPWLEIHNPTSLPAGLPGRAISLGGRSERSWLIRTPLTRRGHFRIEPLQIRTGDPFGFFESSASSGRGST